MIVSKKQKAKLRKVFYNHTNPAGFASIKKLANATKIHPEKVKLWLNSQRIYTLFKPKNKRKNRHQKTIVYGINKIHQLDLLDVSRWKAYNNKVTFLLTIVDSFSRRAIVTPLTSKGGKTVSIALRKVYKENTPPKKFHTDLGTEFYNKFVKEFCEENNIHHFSSNSEFKAALVERFNRTLSGKIYKLIYHKNSHRYIDLLPAIVKTYNNTKHRAHGFKPNSINHENTEDVWDALYNKHQKVQHSKIIFSVNDYVRKVRYRAKFTKGFIPNFTEEVYKIIKIKHTKPKTYQLEDLEGESLNGFFYSYELVKVENFDKDGEFLVDKVLKTRTVDGNKEHFVKYFDLPAKFNAWIPEKRLRTL